MAFGFLIWVKILIFKKKNLIFKLFFLEYKKWKFYVSSTGSSAEIEEAYTLNYFENSLILYGGI